MRRARECIRRLGGRTFNAETLNLLRTERVDKGRVMALCPRTLAAKAAADLRQRFEDFRSGEVLMLWEDVSGKRHAR